MFGKILRAGKGGHGLKYKIDLQVIQLENLPTSIKKCRVVWARSAKLQMTDIKDVRGSVASFKQNLTQVTTVYRDKAGKYEPKEYEFKVQVPGKSSSDSPVTVGKNVLDMAKYCKDETTTQQAMVPITFKIGTSTTGYLKLSITTIFLGDSNEDGQTEVSGLTGLTSDQGSVREQDLEGFVDEEHSKFSKRAKSSKREDAASSAAGSTGRGSTNRADAARRHKPLPPTAEEEDSDLDDEPQPALPTSKSARRKPSTARASEVEEAEEESANPFAKKVSKQPLRKVPPKVWEDDEDVSPLNSDDSDSEPPKLIAKAKKVQEPDEPLDGMKAALFATKKTGITAGRGATGAAASDAAPSSKAASSKPSKASVAAPTPPPAEDDDDSLRNDLFSAMPKGSMAAVRSKSKAAAAATTAGAVAAGASAAATVAAKQKSKAAPPPPLPPGDGDEEKDDDLGPSSSAVQPVIAAPKSRTKLAELSDPPMLTGPSSLARVGSSKPESSKAGSAAELDQLRQRVAQLEQQLADEQSTKEDLSKKVQKYVDKIADLEDQIAEGGVTDLYAQMKEMEAKYQAEIKELMERHLAEVEELEESHQAEIAELEEAAASGSGHGRGGASTKELEQLRAQLAEQDNLLKSRTAKLESDQAAAIAARQVVEVKLAEANKMIDDTLLVATKHQHENKVLQEEIARLKRQLEDASMWDTSAAVTAATAASSNGQRNSQVEAELEDLRERLEELEEENARLQKLVSTRGRASRALSDAEDKKRIEELQAANQKLEAVCDNLEEKAHAAQEQVEMLQAELEVTSEKIRGLEAAAASAAAMQKRMEEEAAASGRQARPKVADLESRVARLAREKATLEEQLEEERATRKEVEEALKDKLDRAGDDEAAETVAAFEVKYNRLKERYKALEESSQEELDELQDQLTEAQSQVTDLQRQVKQLQSQLAQNRSAGASSGLALNSANLEELRSLRAENERLVQQLVSKTMELAELSESEITIRRELARLQEVNRKLAQKATSLEAQAAVAHAGRPSKAKK